MNQNQAAAGVPIPSQFAKYYRWIEPDSNLTVWLNLDTVERLQLQALSGADPGSRAGNEVGGILLGRTESDNGRVSLFVDDFEPVACEHLDGPFYALYGKDATDFEVALSRGSADPARSVLGYYRSHNRDGMFLSEADLRLIRRHFHGTDNLFLLIKTLPNRACTAGFFFWKDGRIQSEFTDSEVPLIPVSITAASPSPALAAPVGTVLQGADLPEVRDHDYRGRLIRGLAVVSVLTAVMLAAVRYREQAPAAPLSLPGKDDTAIPVASAVNTSVAPAGMIAPKPISPNAELPLVPGNADTPAGDGPAPATPLPASVTPPPTSEDPIRPAIEVLGTDPSPRIALPNSEPAPPSNWVTPASPASIGPLAIYQVIPEVPHELSAMITTEVQVDVAVAIDIDGKVTAARVASTTGAAAVQLTSEALKAAQSFRFRPARENNRNVASSTVLTFHFVPAAEKDKE